MHVVFGLHDVTNCYSKNNETVVLCTFTLTFLTCRYFCLQEMPGTRVYIGGLPQGVRERDVERFLRGYGRLRDVLLKNGFGFVVSAFVKPCFQSL